MTVDIGYVGLDHHHRAPYLETLAELPVEVTCACEPDPSFDVDMVDGLGDVPVYGSVEALLDREDVDVLWITLSNRDTPAAMMAALDRGIDVYTEKPAARTDADLVPVVKAAEVSDATVGVSYAWRGHPVSRELRERATEGFFGDVRSFEARFLASSLAFRDTDHYLFDRAASRGGILQWLGIHWLDLVPWILDDPVTAVAADTASEFGGVDVEDSATLQLRTESGALGTLRCGYHLNEGRYDTYVGINGADAGSRWDPMGREFGFDGETALELERTDERWTSTPWRTLSYEYDDAPGYGGQWGREFVEQFFRARESPDVDVPAGLEDARRVLRLLDAAYEAAGSDRWVSV